MLIRKCRFSQKQRQSNVGVKSAKEERAVFGPFLFDKLWICGLFNVDCLTVRIESSADSDLLSFMRLHQILAVDVIARATSVL
jgi:hypothetical protein